MHVHRADIGNRRCRQGRAEVGNQFRVARQRLGAEFWPAIRKEPLIVSPNVLAADSAFGPLAASKRRADSALMASSRVGYPPR
jgi:hypothetical protein